jgi:hypothetical protein
MTSTQIYELTDDDVRLAVLEFLERNYDLKEGSLNVADLSFGVEQGYNGEMGGPSTPNKVSATLEVVK